MQNPLHLEVYLFSFLSCLSCFVTDFSILFLSFPPPATYNGRIDAISLESVNYSHPLSKFPRTYSGRSISPPSGKKNVFAFIISPQTALIQHDSFFRWCLNLSLWMFMASIALLKDGPCGIKQSLRKAMFCAYKRHILRNKNSLNAQTNYFLRYSQPLGLPKNAEY